jgi:threonine-phosphate decarboxylase
MIEGHGDDGWKYAVPLRADFSSNVFYGGLDAGLREHLRGVIDGVTHYPEAGAVTLQHAAAAAFGVDRGSALVTNGATEAIYLIAQWFRGRAATIVGPTFSEYADACTLHGIDVRHISWEELVAGPPKGLVFICNPNNPTGRVSAVSELIKAAGAMPDTLFVVDESYIEFAAAAVVGRGWGNVLVLRSLTKSCRIPGLRLGFLMGEEGLVTSIGRYKMPWSVNKLALEAGSYILGHRDKFTLPVVSLLAATAEWRRELVEATGWRVWDTDTHYFLMETPEAFTAAQLKLHLVSRHGLLIRDAANFKGLGPCHFRVACQSPGHNQLLTEALRECSRTGI